ncbi:SDR family NAD(P)-dependent oxidoreductase [Sphingomonas sp. BAUL-RG-20F-R05-02]|uniref:SDR family NAD(P)-dependent oxidoreductase n=1 Tax=Sphingomonas sp. BAUL-RG-20F-R05-02 TaxID=2914830 RepID=UPI001F5884BF|nr:SDR family NAD(P)-dependent oxidoreductase [Sphingomonas sp. BAUL-RG-20F-R05-02]
MNNAGVGFPNALEGTPIEAARHILETKTLGTIAMMQAVLPQMRERRNGVVVNVTSSDLPAAAAAVGLHSHQGGRECLFRQCGSRTRAVQRARPGCATGPRADDALRGTTPTR